MRKMRTAVQLLNHLRVIFSIRDHSAKRLACEAVDNYRSCLLTRSATRGVRGGGYRTRAVLEDERDFYVLEYDFQTENPKAEVGRLATVKLREEMFEISHLTTAGNTVLIGTSELASE
jgi:hypothetical protein